MNHPSDQAQWPSALKSELWWLGCGLLLSFGIGVLVGLPRLLPALFLLGMVILCLQRIAAITSWLRSGARAASAPDTFGLMNEIVELIHREKKYSRKQKHRYRATLAQFNKLAADLPDAAVVMDDLRQIRWSNTAARNLLNIRSERDRGQRLDNLLRDPELHEFLQKNDPTLELEVFAPGNDEIVLAVRKVPSGNNMSVFIARDVTQRVQVREMRKAFVGDVSHELRTPLTVIQGYLEMLREDTSLPSDVRKGLDNAAEQSDRMQQIVEHLLELSKLEGNPLGVDEGQVIQMQPMLSGMVGNLQGHLGSDHRIELSAAVGLNLLGSETEIYSACHNLLINAIKYTSTGTTITVTWSLGEQGHPLVVVEDDGPGIEARHLPRLSERFYRVDKSRSRSQGGTGLGLAIVKHAAQRHGGRLLIDSEPGIGSRFTIEFPASRALNA